MERPHDPSAPRRPVETRLATAIVLLAVVAIAACTAGASGSISPSASSNVATSSAAPLPSAPASQSSASASPVYTVSQVLALRERKEPLGERVTIRGYWTDRSVAHSCAAPAEPHGDLEIRCHDGEYGVTELEEPIGTLTIDGRFVPARGPAMTPFFGDKAPMLELFTLPIIDGQPFPPVPIVLAGHFDDPRASDCQAPQRQVCRDRFVVEQIIDFDREAASLPAVTPPPSPFPIDDPPPAPFTAAECSGDVPYSFVGWGRLSDFDIDAGDPEAIQYLMVTRDEVDLGEPGGPVGRRVCYAREWERGLVSYAQLP